MKPVFLSLALASLVLSVVPHASAQLRDSFSPGEARDARNKGDVVPLRDIFAMLKRRYGGYQIDANLYERGGQQVYIVDWMTEKGERVRVTVDARTGRILS